MKTLGLLFFAVLLCGIGYRFGRLDQLTPGATPSDVPTTAKSAEIPRTVTYANLQGGYMQSVGMGRPSAAIPLVQLGSREPRQFSIRIAQVLPGGFAKASGTFEERGEKVQCGDIIVNGLPSHLVDRSRWDGWLVRVGTETLPTVLGAYRTFAAYRVISAEEGRAILEKPVSSSPGGWMWNNRNGSALDRKRY